MSNKNYVPLNEFVLLQRGFDLPQSDRICGDIPVVASTGVAGFHNEYKVDAPGVVIGRSGSIGGGQYITKKFWPLNTTLWVKDFKGHDARYVYYLLKSIDFQRFNVGTGVPTLNRNHLSSVLVKNLGYKNEKLIAKILGDLDDKIHLNNQLNKTLESIAQALFKSWFIDFDPVRAKIEARQEGKDPVLAAMCVISGKSEAELRQMAKEDFAELQATAALFPDELVESELGEVPKGWEYKKLKDLCRVINGRAYKNTEFKDQGIPIVRIQNLTGGGKTVFSDLDLPQDKLIEKEDFIYAWSATFGPYIWRGPKSIYHYHIWKMDVDETIISRYFLYLTMFRKTESMKSSGTGSIFTHLTKAIMESQDVLIADNAINMLFKDRIDRIFKLISLKSDEINNLENIRDTLLPKLLSGEVEIPDFINEGE